MFSPSMICPLCWLVLVLWSINFRGENTATDWLKRYPLDKCLGNQLHYPLYRVDSITLWTTGARCILLIQKFFYCFFLKETPRLGVMVALFLLSQVSKLSMYCTNLPACLYFSVSLSIRLSISFCLCPSVTLPFLTLCMSFETLSHVVTADGCSTSILLSYLFRKWKSILWLVNECFFYFSDTFDHVPSSTSL